MIFLFNNKEKPQETAFGEIKQGLSGINDNTLMFLDNIKTIEYKFENVKNTIEREDLDEIKINILNNSKETITTWLKFKKNITDTNKQFVSCVFKLEKDEKTKQKI